MLRVTKKISQCVPSRLTITEDSIDRVTVSQTIVANGSRCIKWTCRISVLLERRWFTFCIIVIIIIIIISWQAQQTNKQTYRNAKHKT